MTPHLLAVAQVPPDRLGAALLRGHLLLSHAVRCLLAVTAEVAVAAIDPRGLADALAADGLPGLRVLDLSGPSQAPSPGQADGTRLVLHDARCPLLTTADVRRVLASGAEAALGVRPVTDTVKTVAQRSGALLVQSTVDRDDYVSVCSPLVISARHTLTLARTYGPSWWATDLGELAAALRPAVEVGLVEVTPWARRVDDEDELLLLECAAGA